MDYGKVTIGGVTASAALTIGGTIVVAGVVLLILVLILRKFWRNGLGLGE